MHRIDDPTAVPTLPAPRPPGTPGYFTGGSPGSSGFAATVVRYEFMNAMQEEIVGVVLAAGMTLDKTNNTQLLQAIRALFRTRLTAPLDLYVATTGNDSNNGSSGSPFATLQAAWNSIINTLDLGGHNVTVHVAAGTYYTGLTAVGSPVGYGTGNMVLFLGNPAAPDSVTIDTSNAHCFNAQEGAQINVSGFRLQATGTLTGSSVPASGLVTNASGVIGINGSMDFGAMPGPHMWCSHGVIIVSSGYTISGGAQVHANVTDAGTLLWTGPMNTVQLVGTPAFSYAFAAAGISSSLECLTGVVTWNGAATGPRYNASLNGVIWTNNAGPNFFPGSAAGITSTGGQYA